MALASFDLLATIVTALFSAYSGSLYRLAIHNARTRLRVPPQSDPQAFSDSPVDSLPGTIDAPFSEVVVDGGPLREVVGKQAPLATALQEIEDGIEDLAEAVDPRSPKVFGSRQVRLYTVPFGIGKIGWVRLSHTC